MKAVKVALLSMLFFSGVFSVISLGAYFGDWNRLIWVACFGLFVGAVAAPEFDRKAFVYPVMLQSLAGGAAGYFLGVVLVLSTVPAFLTIVAGLVLGGSAGFWVKHVQAP